MRRFQNGLIYISIISGSRDICKKFETGDFFGRDCPYDRFFFFYNFKKIGHWDSVSPNCPNV